MGIFLTNLIASYLWHRQSLNFINSIDIK
jgi:hypothetical protein